MAYVYDFEKRFSGEVKPVTSLLDVMEAYISDPKAYDIDGFCTKYRVTRSQLASRVKSSKTSHPELYKNFNEARNANKIKFRRILESNIDKIAYGILTGQTVEGNEFNVLEFYKLLPFIGKDFYAEMRYLMNDFDDLKEFQKVRQSYCSTKKELGDFTPCSYSDNFNVFVQTLRPTFANIISQYMAENKIRSVNPIHRVSFINGCKNSPLSTISEEECLQIFAYMDENNYPCILEVFDRLKEEKVNSRTRK